MRKICGGPYPLTKCGLNRSYGQGEKTRQEDKYQMDYLEIEKVIGREIIDSRGNPTVEAEVYLERSEEEQHQAERPQENSKHLS